MIPRLVQDLLLSRLITSNKIILLYGARQVGKTTLVKSLESKLKEEGKRVLYLNCDIDEDKATIDTTSRTVIKQLAASSDFLLIDEAQGLTNPGLTLKNIQVVLPSLKILATGSSSFELRNALSDALTGRYIDFTLFPLSLSEILANDRDEQNPILTKQKADALLPSALIHGFYPEVHTEGNPTDKKARLNLLLQSYLYKDVLSFQRVKNSQAIKDLTRALAYQIGSELNENELANRIKIDRKTVGNYLTVLEKSFIIFRAYPYSKNPRREIGKNYKIYFVDLGIRNALIGDFNPVHLRKDAGFLWENFLFIERLKSFANQNTWVESNFWRSYTGAEIDYLEKTASSPLAAFEFKYTKTSLSKGASSFKKEYGLDVDVISKENYLDFILNK